MLFLLLQRGWFGERVHRSIDARPAVALRLQVAEQVGVLALASAYDGCEYLELCALFELKNLVDDLLWRLARDRLTARRAVRTACARKQQA